MAYYHLHVSIIGRSQGRSAVACAAYRAGQALMDERYGKTQDYTKRRRGILATTIMAPEDAPTWVFDRGFLWNYVEAIEKRKDSQLSREFELAFPHEIPAQERKSMVEAFIQEELLPLGMVVDYAIHAPHRKGDQRNFHAHLMTTMRLLEGDDFSKVKERDWNSEEWIWHWRERWAGIENRAFERLGIRDANGQILRVDHRSYKQRGIDLDPTFHLGPHATAMERHGIRTEIGDQNREIQRANERRQGRPFNVMPMRDDDDGSRPDPDRPRRRRRDIDKDRDYDR